MCGLLPGLTTKYHDEHELICLFSHVDYLTTGRNVNYAFGDF